MRSRWHLYSDVLLAYMVAVAALGFMWWSSATRAFENEMLAWIALLLIALLAGLVGSLVLRTHRLEERLADRNPPPPPQ
jgi:hypothetical protein